MNDKAPTSLVESVHDVVESLSAAGSAAVRLEQATEQAVEQELRRHPRWRTALGVLGWVLMAIYFLFAAAVLSLRYWVLPHIDLYRTTVEGAVSKAIGETVTIGAITVHQVATVIQTGDHVFQVTVTSRSPERAEELSRQVVPTFDAV